MAAEISFSFGEPSHTFTPEEARLCFEGCCDAFAKIGLSKPDKTLISIIKEVRVFPNHNTLTVRQAVIEIVISWKKEERKANSSIFLGNTKLLQKSVSDKIVEMANELARELKEDMEKQTKALEILLN